MVSQLIDGAHASPAPEVGQALETALLLDAVYWYGGVDARRYPAAATAGAIDATRSVLGLPTITALLDRIVHRQQDLQRLLRALATVLPQHESADVLVQEWRETLAPLLRSTPFPKIWVVDCVDVALLQALIGFLRSEHLTLRTALFVTAANAALLRRLQDAVPGPGRVSRESSVEPNEPPIVWTDYSLQTDSTFNEFEFILCGTALDELSDAMRRRAVRVLGQSVSDCGLLQRCAPALEDAANLVLTFLPVSQGARLYRHATLALQTRQRQSR